MYGDIPPSVEGSTEGTPPRVPQAPRGVPEVDPDTRGRNIYLVLHTTYCRQRASFGSILINPKQELDVGWCNSIDYSTGCVVELIQNCVEIRKLFLTAHRQTSGENFSFPNM